MPEIKIDFNNNNNTYFLLKKEDYDNCYFLGSTVKYNEVFNRRLNLRYNIQQYICDNCNYHSYSNIRIAQLYLTLTLEIIDTFNKGLISIFNNKKVYKEIPYSNDTFKYKRIITLDNNSKYIIYILESEENKLKINRSYLCRYLPEIKDNTLIKCIDITNINIYDTIHNYESINFVYFLYLINDFIESLFQELKELNLSINDILFDEFEHKNIINNKKLYESLENLFFSLNKVDLHNVFIRKESLIKDKIKINYLNNNFYFDNKYINNTSNNQEFLNSINSLLKSIRNLIENKISLRIPDLKKEKNFCSLIFKDIFSSSFSSNCKLGIDFIKDPSLIKNISDNTYINNIINNSIYIKNKEFYYKNNIIPLKIEEEVGLFYNLNSPFYQHYWYLLIKKDNIFTTELFGNTINSGLICPGNLKLDLNSVLQNQFINLNYFFNSIFTIESEQKFIIKSDKDSNFYLDYHLNIHSEKYNLDEYNIERIINPENKYISSIIFNLNDSFNFNITSIQFNFLNSSYYDYIPLY